ncbi:hypothetical protein [Ferruginibacter albus]|uniref:hypothetical protein n=1 Tax=Ferruginibacter albus TaxID=2875540 RepID=UPI001CC38C2C|nr:hypothetical protein [Ferruginibacter albus]UAY52138.1 hypothetical protein K9M53_00240 [Ferruginibacter albus]
MESNKNESNKHVLFEMLSQYPTEIRSKILSGLLKALQQKLKTKQIAAETQKQIEDNVLKVIYDMDFGNIRLKQ